MHGIYQLLAIAQSRCLRLSGTDIHTYIHIYHQDTTPPNAYVTIPYVKNTSESIKRNLAPLGIRTFFQPTNTLRQVLVCPKDPVLKENRSGVIYQIPCSRCPQTYIGQTGRTLGQRLKEHQRAIRDRNTSTVHQP